jgi:hypothetical protein
MKITKNVSIFKFKITKNVSIFFHHYFRQLYNHVSYLLTKFRFKINLYVEKSH